MWWQDLFWGFWNGLTAWVVFIVHVFGGWPEYPFYDIAKGGNWYDLGFVIGAGSPILGGLVPAAELSTFEKDGKLLASRKAHRKSGFKLPSLKHSQS